MPELLIHFILLNAMSLITLVLENDLTNILGRFMLNMAVIFVLVRIIYYRYERSEEFLFSFFLMGIIVFFICSILESVNIQLGMGLGLFAIFSILRFRTVNYSVKDMTYVFVVIGISVINSLGNIDPPVVSAIVINSIILVIAYILELFYQKNSMSSLIIIYNKLELLVPALKDELLKDLSLHTGCDIKKIKIRRINVSNGNSEVEVYFRNKDRS